MNFKDKLRARSEALRMLSLHYKVVLGAVRLNSGNTLAHEQRKFDVCWELARQGHEFVTEAVFESGKRADVLDVTGLRVIEVLSSETEEECIEKVRAYPEMFEVLMVRANVPWNAGDIL
mgnify:CR=1 FL=1